MLDKKEFYENHHDELVKQIEALTQHLLTYPDSRYRKVALERAEDAYLWATQMIQAKLRDAVEKDEKEEAVVQPELMPCGHA